jgi:hypothetical protein
MPPNPSNALYGHPEASTKALEPAARGSLTKIPMNHQSSVTPAPQAKVPSTPRAAKEAFTEGVELFSNWSGGPEPTVPYEDTDITLTAVCKLVAACHSPLPKSAADTLKFCDVGLATKTYSGAASALLRAIRQFKQRQ